jgi:hypothetical protein
VCNKICFSKKVSLTIADFKLPPALAGGIGMNIKLTLAEQQNIFAKAIDHYPNIISLAKARGYSKL